MTGKFRKLYMLITIAVVSGIFTSTSANAGMMEFQGVSFSSSWTGDVFTLELDADTANLSGDWSDAIYIDSIAINDVGTWRDLTDIMLDGPGSFGGPIEGTGLNAGGCKSLAGGSNHPCWNGLATLSENMIFTFNFASTIGNYNDTPHVKVRFLDANMNKAGSLFSRDLFSTAVPEPTSLALMAIGLAALSFRRKK